MKPPFFSLALLGLALGCAGADPVKPPDSGLGWTILDASEEFAPLDSAGPKSVDGSFDLPDGGTVRADRFIMKVDALTRGGCGTFGDTDSVLGPPEGAGPDVGSTGVLSLGKEGTIVVSFGSNSIVDGPGPDFIVFENPFFIGGDSANIYAEPGEVSVSDDGVTWHTFDCKLANGGHGPGPWGACAGWHPVFSNVAGGIAPGNMISPFELAAGGESYDLATVGLAHARFVRVHDNGWQDCVPDSGIITNGFDLDAIAILNPSNP